ncbi:MAG: acyl carrier protein [Firmicutes bacterium]|nr:acyl carrier protein [Bacillota bacterium]
MQEQVIAVIAKQLSKKPESIKLTDRMQEDLHADSLDLIDMLMTLEEDHGIVIPDEVAGDLKTVGDVVKYLQSALA